MKLFNSCVAEVVRGSVVAATLSIFVACQPPAKKSVGEAPAFADGKQGAAQNPAVVSQGNPATPTPVPVAILPPAKDAPLTVGLPKVAVAYDFRGTFERTSATAAVIRMVIQSGALKGATAVRLTGKISNLRNSSEVLPLDVKSSVDSRGVIDTPVTGLSADNVYRITDMKISSEGIQSSESIKDPYFIATTGESKLSKARRLIVLKALAEGYDWDNRNYDRSKDYASSGGWCDRFYSWSVSGNTSLKYPNYAPSYFQRNGGLNSSADIKTIAAKESLAGDMVRYDAPFLGNHTFMIVAFDQATNKLQTVEGNFNNRVMRSTRNVEGAFKLGHLTESMLR